MTILTTTRRVRVIADPSPAPVYAGAEITIRTTADQLKWSIDVIKPLETGQVYTIDWGDGTTSEPTVVVNIAHEYTSPGEYVVRIPDIVSYYTISCTRSSYMTKYSKMVYGFRYGGTALQILTANCFIGCDNLAAIHLSKAVEATIKATEAYQTSPQFGSNATVYFDL